MDNDRQVEFARRRDLGTETFRLPVTRGIIIVIVEPRLANRNTPGMIGSTKERINIAGVDLVACFVRVNPCAEPDVVIRLGKRAWPVDCRPLHPDGDDAVYSRI